MAKAQTTSENPQGEVSQQDTPVLPMQYDVRIHSIQFDGPCRATASLNINGCFAVRGVKLMEGSNGLFVSMPGQINSKGEIKDICFPYTREARAELESAVVTAYQQALTQGSFSRSMISICSSTVAVKFHLRLKSNRFSIAIPIPSRDACSAKGA